MSFFEGLWNGLNDVALWWNQNLGFGAVDKLSKDLLGTTIVPKELGYQTEDGKPYVGRADRQAREEREWNAEQSALAFAREKELADIAYEREMEASNTAYQRAADDMKAAGLNPALAYSNGGASVPNYSVPSYSAASYGGIASSIQSGQNLLSSALTYAALSLLTKGKVKKVGSLSSNMNFKKLKTTLPYV